ncbi:non-ribosomal peptide synthetase [Streptomyces anulatus]|uniref:non-ribosomal peptide synthetase n=1 Tax=Streptomyces anulatus TaxID=1892 RepID=UPI00343BDB83
MPSAVVDALLFAVPEHTGDTVLHGAFAVLLHRHTAQDEIGMSDPVARVFRFDARVTFRELLRAAEPACPQGPLTKLTCGRSDEGWSVRAELPSGLMDAEAAARMLARFETVLAALADDPDIQVADVPVVSGEDEDGARSVGGSLTPPVGTVTAAFEAQASRTPDAIALESEAGTLTYAELDRRAEAAAGALSARLDSATTPFVGVYMVRSPDLVVALVAIMKAGFGYVPIDPDSPTRRTRYLVDNARLDLVLCAEEHLAPLREAGVTATTVAALTRESPPSAPRRPPGPHTPIYMIYTSGSTGEPKGVVNHHAGVLNTLLWRQETWPLTAADKVLQKTSLTFDISAWELFWPLVSGATLVLAKPGGHRDLRYIKQVIRERGITLAHFVPSVLDVFLGEANLAEHCGTLRRVLCSGEALPASTVARFHERLPCELHNLYGPTEASIEVSHWQAPPDHTGATVPIGKAISNTRLYVMDAWLRPQPVGAVGELCIGGAQVALGYHGLPGMTAERFVPDPYGGHGARMYRTGDLARARANGVIEYLGRIDDQVKIRGFRVELGEIEAALRAVPGVDAAAVVARGDAADRQLVAFVVRGADTDDMMLRTELGRVLPAYMIPDSFVTSPTLPMTPNGKLDRRALVRDAGTEHAVPDEAAQLSELESTLCRMFSETLGGTSVGVHDDFFAHGGHSLTAVKVVNRVNAALGVEIDVWTLFEFPTPAELAQELDL